MIRNSVWLLIAIIAGAVMGLPAMADENPTDAARFSAGFRTLSAEDTVGQTPVPMSVWYPASGPEVPVTFWPYTMKLVRNAAPAEGRFPLVAISHGHGGSSLAHCDTATYLARSGFVVVAPTHPGDNYKDISQVATASQLEGRSRHMALSVDRVLADPALSEITDPGRIGVIGFSVGGYTALTLIGGKPEKDKIFPYCDAYPDDRLFCSGERLARLKRIAGGISPVHDRRIRAAVLLAPAYGMLFDKATLADIGVPVRLYRAEKDQSLRFPFHAGNIRRSLPVPPEYVVVRGAGHFFFMPPCPADFAEKAPDLCQDAPGTDRVTFHRQLNREIRDFFERTL
ncbi:dienelactone hydrolase [Desulfonema ishimotonii]|uniref:Dienelactone hydrolase n=1 Tax=Desulfonema ishimotonii TaxID=45657 RepID=A0A401FS76_9BACT|nr:dienelactone hydrolase family protein [Desulfonema ishimotonii]GBC59815.1 dienelactone hydrolase [Desulfonema ishimotonii]